MNFYPSKTCRFSRSISFETLDAARKEGFNLTISGAYLSAVLKVERDRTFPTAPVLSCNCKFLSTRLFISGLFENILRTSICFAKQIYFRRDPKVDPLRIESGSSWRACFWSLHFVRCAEALQAAMCANSSMDYLSIHPSSF